MPSISGSRRCSASKRHLKPVNTRWQCSISRIGSRGRHHYLWEDDIFTAACHLFSHCCSPARLPLFPFYKLYLFYLLIFFSFSLCNKMTFWKTLGVLTPSAELGVTQQWAWRTQTHSASCFCLGPVSCGRCRFTGQCVRNTSGSRVILTKSPDRMHVCMRLLMCVKLDVWFLTEMPHPVRIHGFVKIRQSSSLESQGIHQTFLVSDV